MPTSVIFWWYCVHLFHTRRVATLLPNSNGLSIFGAQETFNAKHMERHGPAGAAAACWTAARRRAGSSC